MIPNLQNISNNFLGSFLPAHGWVGQGQICFFHRRILRSKIRNPAAAPMQFSAAATKFYRRKAAAWAQKFWGGVFLKHPAGGGRAEGGGKNIAFIFAAAPPSIKHFPEKMSELSLKFPTKVHLQPPPPRPASGARQFPPNNSKVF